MEALNLKEKLSLFSDYWRPRVIAELNGQEVKLVKLKGPFVWHHHDAEDELFLVVRGELRMEFRDRNVLVKEGEAIMVPRGIDHRPVAEDEAHVLLFEPVGVRNTGNITDDALTAPQGLRI
jgi:mannose-6-phosphate isomerase-like protein (cupin superfamily)